MNKALRTFAAAAFPYSAGEVVALEAEPQDVYVKVVDVGAGLCSIVEALGPHYMIYDAGHWNGNRCTAEARDIVDGGIST